MLAGGLRAAGVEAEGDRMTYDLTIGNFEVTGWPAMILRRPAMARDLPGRPF